MCCSSRAQRCTQVGRVEATALPFTRRRAKVCRCRVASNVRWSLVLAAAIYGMSRLILLKKATICRILCAAPQSNNAELKSVRSFENLGLMERVENPAEPYQPGKYYPPAKATESPAVSPKPPSLQPPAATPKVPSQPRSESPKPPGSPKIKGGKPPGSPRPKGGKKR